MLRWRRRITAPSRPTRRRRTTSGKRAVRCRISSARFKAQRVRTWKASRRSDAGRRMEEIFCRGNVVREKCASNGTIRVALAGASGYGDHYLDAFLPRREALNAKLVGVVETVPQRCRCLKL